MTDIILIVVLVLGGLALILAEICTPSFGALALAAIACFGFALYKSFQVSPQPWVGMGALLVLLIGLPGYLVWAVRLFPRTPLGRRLAMGRLEAPTGGGVPPAELESQLLGAEGIALGPLRPAGMVNIAGKRIAVIAESAFIPSGTAVKVIRVSGLNIVVRALDATA